MPTLIIRTSYDVVTPESAEFGDCAERGWYDEEGQTFTFAEAVRFLRSHAAYFSGTQYWSHGWYSSLPHEDYRTGSETTYAYHVEGSERAKQRLFDCVFGKKARV